MRAAKAKALRQMARAMTQGKPAWHLIAKKTNATTHLHHPESTRGQYQLLKKFPWRFKRNENGRKVLVAA